MAGRRPVLQWRKLARQSALACRGLRLLLCAAAAAEYVPRRPCRRAAAELPALCAAETSAWFAAARGVASGVCATRAILLCGNRRGRYGGR